MKRYSEISKYRKSFDVITNWVHYPIASYLCAILSYTSITPNQITLLAIISELSAVYLIVSNFEANTIAIVVLLQLGLIFDLMDGMMARYKKMGFYHPKSPSNRGFYLDSISDHVLRFLILGTLAYHFSEQNANGWILGLLAIVIHGITQTEHTLRTMITKSNSRKPKNPDKKENFVGHIALLLNNVYLFYFVFILLNRIDLLLITFAIAEITLFIKRVALFWISEP
ncbi:CDP-alcohol phosphatidyltransferase family protein [Candidatus Neomarinimicrobiota bacterium]